MGYRCPVCDLPQADGEHLANHLAITAMTHGDEHEAWLDEHAPGWAESGPSELAGVVTELAVEVEHETVFEDTTGEQAPRFEDELRHQLDAQRRGGAGRGTLAPNTREVVEEARELTARMLEGSEESDAGGENDAGGESDAGSESDGNPRNEREEDS